MTLALLIIGIVFLLIGGVFFYLNNNSPIQTCIPALAFPLGAAALLTDLGIYIGRMIG